MKTTKQWLSLMLSLIMVFSIFTSIPITANGAEVEVLEVGAPSQSEAVAWLNEQVGKSLDFDGAYGAQCVDLIKYYYNFFGYSSYARGNGEDYASNALPPGWTRIKGGTPQVGDILVWVDGPSGLGHVGICGGSDRYFHQNWSGGYVEIISKSYTGGITYKAGGFAPYWGVIRPQFGNHTHNYNTLVYYGKSHPHYNYYQCSCGEVVMNTNEKVALDTCSECLADYKASLSTNQSFYVQGENVTISWNRVPGATHYNLQLYKINEDGSSQRVSRDDLLTGTSFTYSDLPVGKYHTAFQTYNSNYWKQDHSDWFCSSADNMYFEINNYVDLGEEFYATITRAWDGMAFTEYELNLALYTNAMSQHQIWRFERQADGSYMICNVATGNYIDLDRSNTTDRNNVKVFQKNEVPAQMWYIVKASGGYSLASKIESDAVIDALGNFSDEGTNLQIYHKSGSQAQVFDINILDLVKFNANQGELYNDDVLELSVNNINGGRGENQITVFTSGFANRTTNTNIYGYEVSFDSNGRYVTTREWGDENTLEIPMGGFVVSGYTASGLNSYVKEYPFAFVDFENLKVYFFKTESDYVIGKRVFMGMGQSYGELPVPHRDGYIFDGWYTDLADGEKIYETSTYNGEKELFARWKAEPIDPTEATTASTVATDPTEATTASTVATDPTEATTASTVATDPTEATTASTVATYPTEATTASTVATYPTEATTASTVATDPTEATTASTVATDPTEATTASTVATDPTEATTESTVVTDPTEETTASSVVTDPTEVTTESTVVTEPSTGDDTKPSDTTEPSTGDDTEPSGTTEPSTGDDTKPSEPVGDKGILGDVNGDGKVNIKDATQIQKFAAKLIDLTEDEKLRADVNADNKNNVKDATAIQKFVAKIEAGFPIGENISA